MGAKESILKNVEVGEPLSDTSGLHKMWTTVFPGRYSGGDRMQVSVFIRDFAETDSEETKKFFENGLQMLKQLRHPSIVSYCTSSVSQAEVCLVTERIQPLELVVEDLEPVEILSGIVNILDGLVFLHDRAGLCHNNVCPSAIFVTADGTWKLGSFECALMLEKSRHWVLSDFVKAIKEPVFTPPEDQQMMKVEVPAHARDSYGFGKLIEFLLPYLEEHLADDKKESIKDLVEKLTVDDAALRPELGAISADDNALLNDLTDLSKFLQNIPLKSHEQKEEFFRILESRLKILPPKVVGRRLVKSLLSRYVLLEPAAVDHLLPSLLEPIPEEDERNSTENFQGILPSGLFKKDVIPELAKIFCVHETSVRLALLTHFHSYVEAFGRNTLEKIVLPELLLGMKDTDDEIVSASLRSLADVVPLLGASTVTGMSHRKYFAEGRPRSERNKLIVEAADLKNVKAALASDSRSADKYDETERKKLREKKVEERRKQLELKRKEKKALLAASRRNSKHSEEKIPTILSAESSILQDQEGQSFAKTALIQTSQLTLSSSEMSANKEAGDLDADWRDWEGEELSESLGDQTEEGNAKDEKEKSILQKNNGVAQTNGSGPNTVQKASLSIAQPNQTPSANSKPKKPAKKTTSSELGAEFDVLAIEIDQEIIARSEPDYFADMEPFFERKPENSGLETEGKKSPTKPNNMFQMAIQDDTNEEPTWGDEDGWGDD